MLIFGIGKGLLTNSYYFPKIAKKAYSFILFGTISDGHAHLDTCCCFSTPSQYNLLTSLMRVSCVFLALGKLGHGEVFSFYLKGDRLSFPVT